ncbi:alpha/beta fold hydrolase [uncultured Roseobacter sp.]|uniref:alpha/beta hydrolase n=1 Tax=uncultured Roseobacter sp. TaxID=114847 RepID=UPI002615674B|nr:alpha/beta fold hydrolase [uncultured Roseobacter sp.]
MSELTDPPSRAASRWSGAHTRTVCAVLLSVVVIACIALLEARFIDLEIDEIRVGETPVTFYRLPDVASAPPVIVAHGFAGSRQMMDQIAVSLARQGFAVASLDLPGHGRHDGRLSPDINNLDGTTAQLVRTVEEVASAIAARDDTVGPVSFVGHSMATDVVIRASRAREDVGGVVAISMYSPAVTATEPRALLIVSGATEGHLRGAGLDAVRLVDPLAREGNTVRRDDVIRRTAVAPYVGHLGVLYAPISLTEITRWLRESTSTGAPAPLDRSGWVAAVLFAGLVLLAWPAASLVPRRSTTALKPVPRRTFFFCLIVPVPAALLIALMPTFGIAGNAGFGTLGAIFGAWGLTQIVILHRAGHHAAQPDPAGTLIYLGLSLTFAVALDRYGAAFLPSGARALVFIGLLVGTVPLMMADTMLVHGASILRRLLARLSFLATLSGAMAIAPTQLGLAFTTLPVLVLFFLVYGTIARWIAARRGAGAVAIGKGVMLAWAVAASTPLFAVASL